MRVLDTCVQPGEMTKVHTYQLSAILYIKSWSDFIRYDAGGKVLYDSRKLENPTKPETAIWTGPLPPHQPKNIGDKDLHAIVVELKK